MITIHPKVENKFLEELSFELFKHKGLLCCVQRMPLFGQLNGYVAIGKTHPLCGKGYDDEIIQKIDVHGGITYCSGGLAAIADDLFGDLWWLGFDTIHAFDIRPFRVSMGREMPNLSLPNEEYRDLGYVKSETKKLAEQLAVFKSTLK